MQISFLPEFESDLIHELRDLIQTWEGEVRALLPNKTAPTQVTFDNSFVIPETGTGGFAAANNVLILAFDSDFQDRQIQFKNLRASYFHESYHIAQGWVGDMVFLPLEEAVLEGAATVFERDRAGSSPGWADYFDRSKMTELYQEVSQLDIHYDRAKWKHYDDATGERWLLYRLGTFIIDEVLKNNAEISIESLVDTKPSEILESFMAYIRK